MLRSIDCQQEFERVRARHVTDWSITFRVREAGGKIEILPDNFLYHTPSIQESEKENCFDDVLKIVFEPWFEFQNA